MSRVHLRIIYGCDDRFEYTSSCVKVSAAYFDSVVIVNCGLAQNTDKFRLAGTPNNVTVSEVSGFIGDIEPVMRCMISTVPVGEWFVWMDADERPTEKLLLNLQNDIEYMESNKITVGRFPSIHHEEGKTFQNLHEFPKDNEAFELDAVDRQNRGLPGMYASPRLMKRTPDMTFRSNYGAHYEFLSTKQTRAYFCRPYVHLKSKIAYNQAVSLIAFTMPFCHDSEETRVRMVQSNEYKSFLSLKRKLSIKTSNDFVAAMADQLTKKEFIDLFLGFENSEFFAFKCMYTWAKEYSLSLITPSQFCGRECCKYGNLQL